MLEFEIEVVVGEGEGGRKSGGGSGVEADFVREMREECVLCVEAIGDGNALLKREMRGMGRYLKRVDYQ